MKKYLLPFFCILLAGFSFVLSGQSSRKVPPQIIAYVEKPSAIYKAGEKIRFKVWYVQPPAARATDFPIKQCKIIPGKKIDFVITGDGGLHKKGSVTSGTEEVIVPTPFGSYKVIGLGVLGIVIITVVILVIWKKRK